jgi:hypothetical protein
LLEVSSHFRDPQRPQSVAYRWRSSETNQGPHGVSTLGKAAANGAPETSRGTHDQHLE